MKSLNLLAKAISIIFHPLLMPIYLAYVMLFTPAFAPHIPIVNKWHLLCTIFGFFLLIPINILLILRYFGKISDIDLSERKERFLPFLLIMLSYIFGLRFMASFHAPSTLLLLMRGVVLNILLVSMISTHWKISAHLTGIGGALGICILLSLMYFTKLSLWAALIALTSGLIGWSRLYLKRHDLAQTICGFLLGFFTMMLSFLLHALL